MHNNIKRSTLADSAGTVPSPWTYEYCGWKQRTEVTNREKTYIVCIFGAQFLSLKYSSSLKVLSSLLTIDGCD